MKDAKRKGHTVFSIAAAVLLSSCATVPTGPSVLVLPGTGKTFDAFQVDNAVCRDWAAQQVGTSTDQVTKESVGAGAAVGTAVGVVAGAALGAASGHAAEGAAVGAGIGLLGGSAAGADAAQSATASIQRRYDNAYVQCMYAKGDRVPVARGSYPGQMSQATYRSAPPVSTPPPQNIPAPPAGLPPPPPEGPSR